MEDVINKGITRADNFLSVVMYGGFVILAMFLPTVALISLIVYPSVTLITYGAIKIYTDFQSHEFKIYRKVLHITIGAFLMVCSVLMIIFIVTWDSERALSIIIRLLAFPMVIIGMAGILKGLIIKLYSRLYRLINALIGVLTFILAYNTIIYAEENFIFHVFITLILLLINVLIRSAMYLSEFGLSLKRVSNFKIVFFIINNYSLENERFAKALLNALRRD